MAVFGYGHVSTAEQNTDNQRFEIERAGYAVEYCYADTVRSKAHAAQRKQFGVLLGKLRARATVVVSKLDSLGRDAPDVLSTIKSLATLGVEVVVLHILDPKAHTLHQAHSRAAQPLCMQLCQQRGHADHLSEKTSYFV
mgnify:CR=1 FL=1